MARRILPLTTLAWCVVAQLVITYADHIPRPTSQAPAGKKVNYEFDAQGAPARVSQRWDIRRPAGEAFGIILSIARCGDSMFLTNISRIRAH